jgi:8-oxo-dGTP pyrophosphatase MutT (NUDIX family)
MNAFDEGVRRALLALVRRHRSADESERTHQEAIEAWLRAAARPLDRGEYEPGHAVGSAVVVSDDGQVALIHHPKLDRWLQPGGHAEPGESDLAEVAAREAREELGLALTADDLELFDLDVHTIPANCDAPEHLHFDFRFLGSVARVPLRPGTDVGKASWFAPDEARTLSTDAGLRRMIDKVTATRTRR